MPSDEMKLSQSMPTLFKQAALGLGLVPLKFIVQCALVYEYLPSLAGAAFVSGSREAIVFTSSLWFLVTVLRFLQLLMFSARRRIFAAFNPEAAELYQVKLLRQNQLNQEALVATLSSPFSRPVITGELKVVCNSMVLTIVGIILASFIFTRTFIIGSPIAIIECSALIAASDIVFTLVRLLVVQVTSPAKSAPLNKKDRKGGRMAAFAVALEEVDQSVQMIETRFQLELQTNPGPSAYNGRGKHHLQVHQFIKAIDDFSQAIVLDAESVEAYENRADAYVGLKLPLLARKDFKDACRLYAAQGKETDRLRVLDKSSELGAVSTVGMREGMTGAAFFFAPKKLDNLTDMELKRINTNLGNNIRTANMFRRKAEILYGQSQFGEAILACDEAIKANGDDGSAYRVRAEIETQQLKLEDALSDFDKAISLNERDETALRGRAMLYFFLLKDNEAALKDCTQGMSFSQNRQLQLLRGKIFIALDRCELAISDLTEFIDAWERFVNLWDALWLPVFKSIADGLRVELVDAYEQRAAAYNKLGQLDKSAEDLARAAHLKKRSNRKRAVR